MYKWFALILILLGVDQISKSLIANLMFENQEVNLINGVLRLKYQLNSGFVFGIQEGSAAQYYYIFVIVVVIAAGLFGYLLVKNDHSDKRTFWYVLSLSLLIAGALGNGIDRLFRPGHMVVDFIDFYFTPVWKYVFNFADICLNIGIAMFLIDMFFLEPKRKKPANG